MAIDTLKIGKLVGTLIKELCNDEQFKMGYSVALSAEPEKTKVDFVDMVRKLGYDRGIMVSDMNEALKQIYAEGQGKILAIKKLREYTKCSLKESKDYVEWMAKEVWHPVPVVSKDDVYDDVYDDDIPF